MIKIDENDSAVRDFRSESAKFRELQIEQGNLGRQIGDKLEILAGMNQQGQKGSDTITLTAQAMLSGNVSLDAVNQANIEEELDNLHQKKRVLEKAIQLQRQIVDKARGKYSLKLNAQAQGQHELNVLRMAKALREVAACFDAENKLFEELRAMRRSVFARCASMPLAPFAITIRWPTCSCGKFRSSFLRCSKNSGGWPLKAPKGLASSKAKHEKRTY